MEYLYLEEYQALTLKYWALKLIGHVFKPARRQRAAARSGPGYFSWISLMTPPLNAP